MKVLHVAGPSNVGKTRLLELILSQVQAAAVIKWTHHELPPDQPGTDTDRLGVFGSPVVLAHPDGFVVRPGVSQRYEVYVRAAQCLDDQALLVVEGDKHGFAPVVWVGPEVPGDVKACLVIGPHQPGEVPWIHAELPLDNTTVQNAANYLRDNLETFTFYLSRSFHDGIH